jgi:hypothetical protein
MKRMFPAAILAASTLLIVAAFGSIVFGTPEVVSHIADPPPKGLMSR